MKKCLFLVLAATLTLAGCKSYPPPTCYTSFIDYSQLASQGIFATESNSVSFDYVPVGSVCVEECGGWGEYKQRDALENGYEIYDDFSFGRRGYAPPSLDNAFHNLAKKLKEERANGIINLKIMYGSKMVRENLIVGTITITGMAIRK